jgi:hypothetical protein
MFQKLEYGHILTHTFQLIFHSCPLFWHFMAQITQSTVKCSTEEQCYRGKIVPLLTLKAYRVEV